MAVTISALAKYLDAYLRSELFPDDQHGIYRASSRPIRRIGLALEPWPTISEWVEREELDALFLHRPWKLDLHTLPEDIGVLAYHLAFDSTLTSGLNQRLADALLMTQVEPFGFKGEVALGMLGAVPRAPLETLTTILDEIFGRAPVLENVSTDTVERIAVVGAMTDALIRDAAAKGTQLYITGQFRQPAREAVRETGMTVALIGHEHGEHWGLRALASLFHERWAGLSVVIARR